MRPPLRLKGIDIALAPRNSASSGRQGSRVSGLVDDPPADVASVGAVVPTVRLDAGLLRIALVCLLPGVMAEFDFTVVYVAQRTFAAAFDTSQLMAAWTATGYALALTAGMAPCGWAINRFGTRRLVVGSVLLLTFGSVLCATAASITLLIAARAVQGIGCGLLLPTTATALIRAAGPARLGRVMSLASIRKLMSPIFGLVLGGWLIDAFGWQWIFLINVPVGVLAAVWPR